MPDDLYDRDVLVWSERQAGLLRRIAAGERLNREVDWVHLIEEVEDLGRSELHDCESLLTQAMIHLLKLHAAPQAADALHWTGEVAASLGSARRRFVPSMRSRIDLAGLYADACKTRVTAPAVCPFDLDMLLDPGFEIDALVARLQSRA